MLSHEGKEIRFHDYLNHKYVVLYFYPKDNTYGCIIESKTFRDRYQEFTEAGAVVVGVSSDGVESHKKFVEDQKLPFTLLSDMGGKVRDLYGVPKTFGMLPGRTTYLINHQGIVEYVFSSQFQFDSHVKNTLAIIQNQSS